MTIAWVGMWALAVFSALKALQLLRVDQQTELAGIDNMEHGGPVSSSRVGGGGGRGGDEHEGPAEMGLLPLPPTAVGQAAVAAACTKVMNAVRVRA